MSATTQYADFSDLYTGLQQLLRLTTGETTTENIAKRLINIGLHDMHIGYAERLPWCERNSVIVTQPQYSTGTATATKGSTTLSGSSTLWDTNNDFTVKNIRAGGKLKINGGVEVYEVSSVTNDTALELTSKFTQDTVAGASYLYFEDAYALASDFLRPIDQRQFSDPMDIELIGRTEFRRRYPRNNITGRPMVGTLVDLAFSGNTTPVRKIVFWKAPDKAYTIPYHYATSNLSVSSTGTAGANLSANADEPIVPKRYRHLIVLYGLYVYYRDGKDDDRAASARAEYEQLLSRMVSDTEIGSSRPELHPDTRSYVMKARRPW